MGGRLEEGQEGGHKRGLKDLKLSVDLGFYLKVEIEIFSVLFAPYRLRDCEYPKLNDILPVR